jgi:hypothetical protein
MVETGMTDMTGRDAVSAAIRRVLFAVTLGAATACAAWLAFWLAMHL